MSLTHIQIEKAKPKEKDWSMSDANGLELLVRSGGKKVFRIQYTLDGKQKRITLGGFPGLTLAEARRRAGVVSVAAAGGIDPKTLDLAADAPDTFEAVARDWHRRNDSGWSLGHSQRVLSRLERELFPDLGQRPITEITPKELLGVLRKLEARGVFDTAKRCKQYADNVFAFAIAEGRANNNPAPAITKAMAKSPRKKQLNFLRDHELPEFLRRLRAYDGDRQTALCIEIIMHTFVRSTELREIPLREIEGSMWRIPAERMKNRHEHLVPLTPHVQELFRELVELAAERKVAGLPIEQRTVATDLRIVAPCDRLVDISYNTMIYAMYRLGYHSKATIHGFRSTASTALNESGLWRSDAIERQLSHVEANQVRGSYNAALYLKEREEMMHWWSDYLLDLEKKPAVDPLDELLG